MLSFLYRLVRSFRHEHGCEPNVVYMNPHHYQLLRASLAAIASHDELVRLLKLDIVISSGALHPHVGRTSRARQGFGQD